MIKPKQKAQRWTIKGIADEAPKVDIEQPKEMLTSLDFDEQRAHDASDSER